jgi:enoyl-CoA hydratase
VTTPPVEPEGEGAAPGELPAINSDSNIEYTCLTVSSSRTVVQVTLSRPPVNAVSQTMYAEIREVYSSLDMCFPLAKVVILRGAGPHFCAGNDLDEFADMTAAAASHRMRLVREAFAAIVECPVPTVAAVHGSALGTGVALASCCDVVVADCEARFGTPEVGVGVMGGGRHLARLVPEQLMRLMYFTAAPMTAAQLAAYGSIISVPSGRLDAEVQRIANSITQHSRTVLRHAKASLNRSEFLPLKAAYEVEQAMTVRLVADADSVEARRALVERRPPRYRD